ncbi:MAG TPA: hypothetical protein VEL05_11175 [Candidatus Acidoferrum sp.]|nr:hypothetical protein [Candidatus Acidoferrum sp.]
MGDRVTARLRAAVLVLAWTLLLGLAMRGLDRWIVGPPPAASWLVAARVQEVPRSAGLPAPAYLPERLAWPPERVLYRADGAGAWIGVAEPAGEEPVLWIGVSGGAPPEALGRLAGCLADPGRAVCPAGWRTLSRALPDGRPVFVLTSLDAREARRVLEGLSVGGH